MILSCLVFKTFLNIFQNLYFFQLDLNLAVEKVSYLKGYIARNCRIPQEKQVLLISGGESLDPEQNVCTYAAGTDTNPIFLFSMLNIESAQSPEVLIEFNEIELNEKVTAIAVIKYTYSCNSYFVHEG